MYLQKFVTILRQIERVRQENNQLKKEKKNRRRISFPNKRKQKKEKFEHPDKISGFFIKKKSQIFGKKKSIKKFSYKKKKKLVSF